MKVIAKKYQVSIPIVNLNTEYFTFSTNITNGKFGFSLRWNKYSQSWACYVTLPDGSIRRAGIWPGCISWSSCLDYGIQVTTDLTTIGINDISSIKLYIIVWG